MRVENSFGAQRHFATSPTATSRPRLHHIIPYYMCEVNPDVLPASLRLTATSETIEFTRIELNEGENVIVGNWLAKQPCCEQACVLDMDCVVKYMLHLSCFGMPREVTN